MKLISVSVIIALSVFFLVRRSLRLFSGKESSCSGCPCGGKCGESCKCNMDE